MHTKGFTLIEVLIGLFIAVIASAYAAKTITSTNKVVAAGRETFIATNLAHEGLDLSRAMRDTSWFIQREWTPPLPDADDWISYSGICLNNGVNTYTIDPVIVDNFKDDQNSTVRDASQPGLFVQANKVWTHTPSSEPTLFSRSLQADCAEITNDPAFVTITSTVTWTGQGGAAKSISLTEELFNWLP